MSDGDLVRGALLAALCVGSTGCRHKPLPPVIPVAAQAPVTLEKPPEPKNPPLVASVPLQPTPVLEVTVPQVKPKKVKKKVIPPPAPATLVEVATAAPTPEAAESVIGALTPGGDSGPARRKAAGLIVALEKRLAGLPAAVREKEREGIVRVRNFQREAQTALDQGDAEGAVMLVTKAKLMLDDLLKS